jgi:hypothetical protein
MKITVQGTFIDTEKIYAIEKIYGDNNGKFCFDIIYYNDLGRKTVMINKVNIEKQIELSKFLNEKGPTYSEEDKIKIADSR